MLEMRPKRRPELPGQQQDSVAGRRDSKGKGSPREAAGLGLALPPEGPREQGWASPPALLIQRVAGGTPESVVVTAPDDGDVAGPSCMVRRADLNVCRARSYWV